MIEAGRANRPERSLSPPRPLSSSRIASLVFVLLLILLCYLPAGEQLRNQGHDLLLAGRGSRKTSAPILLVGIDEATYTAWKGTPVAFWSGYYGDLLAKCLDYGAAVVGLDIIPEFDGDTYLSGMNQPQDKLPNSRFARIVDQAGSGRIVLGHADIDGKVHLPSLEIMAQIADPVVGLLNLPTDPDGVIRCNILYRSIDGQILPGLSAALAAAYRHRSTTDRSVMESLTQERAMPDPLLGVPTFGINYTGKPFPTISARRVLAGLSPEEQQAFRGRIVLIGNISPAEKDFLPTPQNPLTPGVQIHAESVATLLDHRPLRLFPVGFDATVTGILGMAVLLALFQLPLRRSLPLCALGAAFYLTGAFVLLVRQDWVLPILSPLASLLGPPVVFLVFRFGEERVRYLTLKAALSPYLSPAICDYLLESEENRRPGGKLTTATCLFLDIRDSVRYGTLHSPDTVMDDLNQLFQEIVPAINQVGGNICKYTGDGLLAVFGAPRPLPENGPNHADAGVAAIRGIIAAVERVNKQRVQNGAEPWRVGCGLNTGSLVFGNLGTAERPEFTLIGDTVNVAARLESLSRVLAKRVDSSASVDAVLGEDTYTFLSEKPAVSERYIEEIRGHGPYGVYLLQ